MNVAFDKFANELNEVKTGYRGWCSITFAAKESGIDKETLEKVAKMRGLETNNHGKYGLVATKKRGG